MPGQIAGLANNTEDANWRAVLISIWDKPTPPPPPPPPPPNLQEPCRRLVVRASNGVKIYTFLEDRLGGHQIIEQAITVKPSNDFKKCATDFERQYSFFVKWPVSRPIVFEYARDPGSDVVGEVVGHVFSGISGRDIVAEDAAVRQLPPPYTTYSLRLDALLNGYTYGGAGADKFVSFGKVPLFVSYNSKAGYTAIGISTESGPTYDVATDVYGQIVANLGTHANRYPRTEKGLRAAFKQGAKEVVKEGAKELIKTLIFE